MEPKYTHIQSSECPASLPSLSLSTLPYLSGFYSSSRRWSRNHFIQQISAESPIQISILHAVLPCTVGFSFFIYDTIILMLLSLSASPTELSEGRGLVFKASPGDLLIKFLLDEQGECMGSKARKVSCSQVMGGLYCVGLHLICQLQSWKKWTKCLNSPVTG